MPTIGEKITSLALEKLKAHPDGVRYTDLVGLIQASDSSLKKNTIHSTCHESSVMCGGSTMRHGFND